MISIHPSEAISYNRGMGLASSPPGYAPMQVRSIYQKFAFAATSNSSGRGVELLKCRSSRGGVKGSSFFAKHYNRSLHQSALSLYTQQWIRHSSSKDIASIRQFRHEKVASTFNHNFKSKQLRLHLAISTKYTQLWSRSYYFLKVFNKKLNEINK